jgi:predicted RNA-binding protein associated with RNAse of E/G family
MTTVSYEDLILDVWVDPQSRARVLDADELAQCRQEGLISCDEAIWIRRQRDAVLSGCDDIIREAEAFERTYRPLARD